MGTRRLEELIYEARVQAYSENYSLTEGWDDNVVASLFNLGKNRLYHRITQIDNPANIEETTIDSVAGQAAYDIPIDVFMAIRLVDVRYKYGTDVYSFFTLQQSSIQDRYDFPGSVPDSFCIRNGQLILSPAPNASLTGGIIINYQKRIRTLDVRRGIVDSKTDSPVTITLTYTASSSKDANLQQNAESVLDKRDYVCLVDRDGNPIVSQIPTASFDSTTQILTAEASYSFPASELAALNAAIAAGRSTYVVSGRYASTHSELDSQCEDFLIEFVIARLLRLQSNTSEMQEARLREEQALEDLVNAYRRYRQSVYPVTWLPNKRRRSPRRAFGGYF